MSGAPASSHVAPASSSRLRRWQGGFRCRKDWIWRRWRSDRGGRHGPPTWAATEVASFSTVARRERSHPTPRPSSPAMTRPCRPTPLLCIRVPHKRRRSRARARAPDSCSRPFFPGRRGVRFSYSRHGAHPVFVKQPLVLAEWVVNLLLVLNCAQQGIYRNNGYLMVSCNDGLNQMRVTICDMVVPELDKTSFWNDPSEFQDIFDVKHFITFFQDEVPIQRELPPRVKRRVELGMFHSMPPISWSDISYYHNQILPLIQKQKVLHLNRTDARLANNGLPMEIQKLRCRVNYASLRFTVEIEDLGKRVIRILGQNGPFLVLHLRYEKDMLAFSGCTQGCSNEEVGELTRMRCAYPWWKEKIIDWDLKRKDGLCPLTPEETALVLRALDIDRSMQIYIAAVEIYGGKSRMAALTSAYPYVVRKDTLLEPSNLMYFQNHSSQMAALIYMVSCCFTCCTNTARLWCVEILIAILKGYIDLISDVCKNCIKKCCIMACGAMYT